MDTRVKPAYDTEFRFVATPIRKRVYIVFRALQNPRHHAVADEFPDRTGSPRHSLAGYPICLPWSQAFDCVRCVACNMRIFAARKSPALSAGITISAMECRARHAGRHYR